MTKITKKKHHHLITAEIVYRHAKDESGQVFATRINGILTDKNKEIPHRLLGKAQQNVQLFFHNRMGDPDINVLDVVILGFSYLGHMTDAEFSVPPEGMKIQVRNGNTEQDPMLAGTPKEGAGA